MTVMYRFEITFLEWGADSWASQIPIETTLKVHVDWED